MDKKSRMQIVVPEKERSYKNGMYQNNICSKKNLIPKNMGVQLKFMYAWTIKK